MKKILLATTVLAGAIAGSSTVAFSQSADVTISGYGRFGIQYSNFKNGDVGYSPYTGAGNRYDADARRTTVHTRLRMDVTATTTTDTGVTFGGTMRLQSSDGGDGNADSAMLFTEFEGFRAEFGNVNTAFDSVGLLYNAEIGLRDFSFGSPNRGGEDSYYSYSNFGWWGESPTGVFASYSIADFTARISLIDTNQWSKSAGLGGPVGEWKKETTVSFDWAPSGTPFAFAAAVYNNGTGIDDQDGYFLGGAYQIVPEANVGLNIIRETGVWTDYGASDPGNWHKVRGTTYTLWGDYTVGYTTLKAYVARNDFRNDTDPTDLATFRRNDNATRTAFGIGADYDLGGAKLTGSIQRGYQKETYADLGVRFDF